MKNESMISQWSKSFLKSISDNAQLVFSRKITISLVKGSLPYSEISDIVEIREESQDINSIVCLFDNRTIIYSLLCENSMSGLSIYFPLSREKYKMTAAVYAFSGNDQNLVNSSQGQQFKDYIFLNRKYSDLHAENTSDNTQSDDNSKLYTDTLFNKLNPREILATYWSKLTSEEKLLYETRDKDSFKLKSTEKEYSDDLSKFTAQEEMSYSPNFAVALFVPLDVEHTIYPMPQVVANSRRVKFESLIKPHKMPKQFFFYFDLNQWKWNLVERNI